MPKIPRILLPHALVACFEGIVTENVIDAIAATNPVRVVFRDSSFTEAANKMNLYELFKQKCSWTDEEVKNNIRGLLILHYF